MSEAQDDQAQHRRAGDIYTDVNEFDRLRAEVHRLAGAQHDCGLKVAIVERDLVTLRADVLSIRQAAATQGDVQMLKSEIATIRNTGATSYELKAFTELINLKLAHINDDLVMIKSTMYKGVGIIVTAVLLAVLALVLKQ
jgi:hypothetical protein